MVAVAFLAPSMGIGAGVAPAAAAGVPQSSRATGPVRAEVKGKAGPLAVRLTSLSPSTVPVSGPLRLRGTVTNTSAEAWQDINVHAFVSPTPMTTSKELADAAATPFDADIGSRLTTSHAFVTIGDLGPGQTATFALRVPRSELPIPRLEPGVYWVGVHALGANKDGRDGVADGRARTFIPLIRAKTPRASVALVLPFRETVRQDAAGRLRDPAGWQQLLQPSGRLGRLLRIAESAGAEPLTLVVDPAVLDAVDALANGTTDPGAPAATSTPSASPTATPSPDATGGADQPLASGKDTAKDWLSRFRVLAGRKRVLGVGYADPDVAALSRLSPDLLTQGYTLGADTFKKYDVVADPAAVPADGHLPAAALSSLANDAVVLLDDTAVTGGRTRWRTPEGQPLIVTDSAAATGGPGPSPATQALALRQRIVAEAALRGLAGSKAPLVVALPAAWNPGSSWQTAGFFRALELPWLRLTGLDTTADAPVRQRLAYPADRSKVEIGRRLVSAAKQVVAAARVYADTLTAPDSVVSSYTRQALQGTSYHARADAGAALVESLGLARSIRLSGIRVVGSSFVTLSGSSGTFVITLVNDLSYPVRVGIQARTDSSDLKITAPRAVVIPRGQRTTVRLKAQASNTGVREVELTPVTREGDAVGTPITFNIRSSQVSSLIWGVMAAGGALLVVMIVRRAFMRGLRRERPGL
jgi:hypothetical protein